MHAAQGHVPVKAAMHKEAAVVEPRLVRPAALERLAVHSLLRPLERAEVEEHHSVGIVDVVVPAYHEQGRTDTGRRVAQQSLRHFDTHRAPFECRCASACRHDRATH